jgi:hypothetical protein
MRGRPDEQKVILETYALAGDGEMAACKKGACVDPCCGPKFHEPTGTIYTTTLLNAAEFGVQERIAVPPLSRLGVDMRTVEWEETGETGLVIPKKKVVISDCLNVDGGCKLQVDGRRGKPLTCRLFPFTLDAKMPIAVSCPEFLSIAENAELIERIKDVRRRLGLRDNEEWQRNLDETIRKGRAL